MGLGDNQRPGVYSSYSVSSSYATPRSSLAAAVVCRGEESLRGRVYELFSAGEAGALLAGEENRTARVCCRTLLRSGVSKVYLSVAGDDLAGALELIEEEDGIGVVVCDAGDLDEMRALRDSVWRSSDSQRERIAFAGVEAAEDARSWAKELCDERMVLCCPGVTVADDDGAAAVYGAAALAGRILGDNDPAVNWNGVTLELVKGAETLKEAEIQALIAGGVCVLEEVGEHVECVRAVTTKTVANGAGDNSLRSVNTVLIVDDVMRTLRSAVKARMSGLRRHSGVLDTILTQVMVELAAKRDEGVIEAFEAPAVRADSTDPSVCIVEVWFRPVHLVDQLHIVAHVEI